MEFVNENISHYMDKLGYIYVLTPKGIQQKTKLTLDFMKREMNEYDELRKEIEK